MAREKTKQEWIKSDAKRRATLKKRRQGLMKKAKELSILCDVPVCAVVYEHGNPEPEVWPAEAEEAKGIIRRFRAMPESHQAKKRVDQQGFTRQQIATMEQKLKKMTWGNKEIEMRALMQQCIEGEPLMGMGPDEALILGRLIAEKAMVVRHLIGKLKEVGDADGTPNPNPFPNPNPSSESLETARLGFNGDGYPRDVIVQPQQPFMGMGTGSGLMDPASPSSARFYHFFHF